MSSTVDLWNEMMAAWLDMVKSWSKVSSSSVDLSNDHEVGFPLAV